MFSIQNVSHGDHIQNLSFEAAPRECIAVVLQTKNDVQALIRLLTGEERLESGSILIDGIPLEKLTPRLLQMYRRSLGLMLTEEELLPDRSVFDHIAIPLRAQGIWKKRREERIFALLTEIHLTKKHSAALHTLSSGEKRRVAIAMALAMEPKIIIVEDLIKEDDDPETEEIIKSLLAKAIQSGATIIIGTLNAERFHALDPKIIGGSGKEKAKEQIANTSWKAKERTRIIPMPL